MHSHLNRNKFWSESSRITRKYVVGDVFIMLQCLSLLHNAPVPVTKSLNLLSVLILCNTRIVDSASFIRIQTL